MLDVPAQEHELRRTTMAKKSLDQLGGRQATQFGELIRERRKALKMNQDDVALASGVGRRFVIELESGKPSCQIGKALLVAEAVGLRVLELLAEGNSRQALLPDMPDEEGSVQ